MNSHHVSAHHRDFGPEQPFSQLSRPLSEREENGSTARDHGFLPARNLQTGSSFMVSRSSRHVGFIHPPLRSSVPAPSANRAGPRRPETCR